MSGEMGRGQTSTFLHVDGVGVNVDMQSQLAKDPMDFGDIPGLDPDAGVAGGVDPSKEDDNCTGGACKI